MFTGGTIKVLPKREDRMTKKTVKRYSEAFKRQVVSEYEDGASMGDLQKKYGITGGATIPSWIKKYAKQGFRHKLVKIQTAEEANRVRELEEQVQELEQALGKVTLEKLKLESILDELEEMYGVAVKKNAVRSSQDFPEKSESSKEGQ
jgi:transposase-like protein